MRPTLSICVPSYNCGPYLKACVESALAQGEGADEIIVSDDRSTDETADVLAEYRADPRLRILSPPQRLSIGAHYRFLLQEAACDFVTFLSADDALSPAFVRVVKDTIAVDPSITLVSTACIEADGDLRAMRTRGTGRRRKLLRQPNGFDYMLPGCLYTVSFSAMSRCRLLEAPALPPDFDVVTDWYWALWLTAAGSLAFVNRPLGYYRIHGSNAGHANPKWAAAAPYMLRFLVPLLDDRQGAALVARAEKMATPRSAQSMRPDGLTWLKGTLRAIQALPYRRLPTLIRQAENPRRG